jgi:2,3,4,5-tetrahydropyridine-2-carboxylate N-succinyltransferase
MPNSTLQPVIEAAWEKRDQIGPATRGEVRDAVAAALDLLDRGQARVAEKASGEWIVNQWLKKAVVLSFRLNDSTDAGAPGAPAGGTGASKFAGNARRLHAVGFRAVPGAVRHSAYVAPG